MRRCAVDEHERQLALVRDGPDERLEQRAVTGDRVLGELRGGVRVVRAESVQAVRGRRDAWLDDRIVPALRCHQAGHAWGVIRPEPERRHGRDPGRRAKLRRYHLSAFQRIVSSGLSRRVCGSPSRPAREVRRPVEVVPGRADDRELEIRPDLRLVRPDGRPGRHSAGQERVKQDAVVHRELGELSRRDEGDASRRSLDRRPGRSPAGRGLSGLARRWSVVDDRLRLLAHELLDVVQAAAGLAGRAEALPAAEWLDARPGTVVAPARRFT